MATSLNNMWGEEEKTGLAIPYARATRGRRLLSLDARTMGTRQAAPPIRQKRKKTARLTRGVVMDRGCHEEVTYPTIFSAIYEAGVKHNEERCYSMVTPVRLNGRELKPHKATVSPLLDARTVLTNSPWEFVSLWLTRQKKTNAHFYWKQAQEFARASVGISIQSAPLLHYYSFMNATKALLAAKSVAFTENHGVGADRVPSTSKRLDLANEGVKVKNSGVLPSLATYLGDTETKTTHTLQDLLFNLPFVHRTYCLTYRNQAELFFTLSDCVYVFNTATKETYLRAKLSQQFSNGRYLKKLPPAFIRDADADSILVIRSKETVVIKSAREGAPEIRTVC